MTEEPYVAKMEILWDEFFMPIREGDFKKEKSLDVINTVNEFEINSDLVKKRLVELLWFIPTFLSWNRFRVERECGDMAAYDRFSEKITGVIIKKLGMP